MPESEVLLYENPRGWWGQSRRHSIARRRHRRNPDGRALALPRGIQDLFQGVDIQDAVSAVAGLASSTMFPATVVRAPAGAVLTTQQKWMKILVSLGAALGVGYLASMIAGSRAGKAAVLGGLAGTTVMAINTFTPIKLGGGTGIVRLPAQTRTGEVGRYPAPAQEEEFTGVRLR